MKLNSLRKPLKIFIFLILIMALFQLGLFVKASGRFLHRHFLIRGKDLTKLYGKDSWVLITGASSGQGKHFAIEMAKKGFNLILVGSIRTKSTIQDLENMIKEKKINSIKIEFIEKDFRKAHEPFIFLWK